MNRVIILVDIDNYEFQLWARIKRPDLLGKNFPVVVINHDNVILSMNPAAKRMGIRRRENSFHSVRQSCSVNRVQLEVIKTAERFGRSDSFTPVKTTQRITKCILNFLVNKTPSAVLERAGSDEWFLDVTTEVTRRQNLPRLRESSEIPHVLQMTDLISHKKVNIDETCIQDRVVVMECESEAIAGKDLQFRVRTTFKDPRQEEHLPEFLRESRLVYGAIIAQELKETIFEMTGFVASFGIGENKLMAKLACEINKPEGITILTQGGFRRLNESHFTLTKLPGFGGIRGRNLEKELQEIHPTQKITLDLILTIPSEFLQNMMKKHWPQNEHESVFNELLRKCRGTDDSPVIQKTEDSKLTLSATFKGPFNEITLKRFVSNLSLDFHDRLNYFNLSRTTITINVKTKSGIGSENNEMNQSSSALFPPEVCNQLDVNTQTRVSEIMDFGIQFILKQNIPIKNIFKIIFSCKRQNEM